MKGTMNGLIVIVFVFAVSRSEAQQPKPISAKPVSHSIITGPKVRTVSVGSPAIVSFVPEEIDLTKLYWTEEELAVLQGQDDLYKMYKDENYLWEFKTSVGLFRVVGCCSRHSINPKAKHSDGPMCDMVQLPNGQWIAGQPLAFSIRSVLERDGKVFLVSDRAIYQWLGNEKLLTVVSFRDTGKWLPSIWISDTDDGLMLGRYFQIRRTNLLDLGGLLEYADGQWKFYPYEGKNRSWIECFEQRGDKLLLTMRGYSKQIQFDQVTGTFTDL